jgi:hypothetical protein
MVKQKACSCVLQTLAIVEQSTIRWRIFMEREERRALRMS